MSVAMRDAFGKKLVELGATHPELVVLDADVSSSTKSNMFAKAYPERFFNVGVAEANMVDIAAGMATAGYRPVVNAFALFLALKGTDQIRNTVCYNNLPVVIAGAYGGLSDSFDGASHQAITDIALMRALPNMQVIVPSDSAQAEQALEYALAQDGPVYIRLNRNAMPDLPPSDKIGTVKITEGADVTIAANGITASFATDAAKLLEKEGIKAEVFSVPMVKPFGIDPVIESVGKTGRLLSVEEHVLSGGFASAIAEVFLKQGISCNFDAIGIEDTFTESGPYEPLLAKYGISAENIAARAMALCR
jgi:transketolase